SLRAVRGGAPGRAAAVAVRAADIDGRLRRESTEPEGGWIGGVVQGTTFDWGEFHLGAGPTTLSAQWNGDRWSARANARGLALRSFGGPPSGWEARVGSASLGAEFEKGSDALHGPLQVRLGSIAGVINQTRVSGDLIAEMNLTSLRPSDPTTDLAGA